MLTLLVCFLSAGKSWAETETATFNKNEGLPAGWFIVGDITNDDTRGRNDSWGLWTYSKSSTDNYVVTSKVTGTFHFYARAYNKNTASEVIVYEYTANGLGAQLYTTGSLRSSQVPSWKPFSFTVEGSQQLAIALNYAAVDDVTFTTAAADETGAALAVSDGDQMVEDGYAFTFGLCEAGVTHDFTLYNPGTEDVTLHITATGGFAVTPDDVTIAAKDTKVLTVTMPAGPAEGTVTIAPTTETVEPVTIHVSGTVKNPDKLFIDFEENPLPDTWIVGSNWKISNGMAENNGVASNIVSGKLTVDAGGEQILFDYKGCNTWGEEYNYIKVYYATTGNDADADWTLINGATFGCTDNTTWRQARVTVPAYARYICLQGRYVCIDNYYGLALPQEPNMVVAAEDHDFGVISADSTYSFMLTNTGRAALTGIIITSSNGAFTIDRIPRKLPAGAETDITVTMSATNVGMFQGVITVSADGFTGEDAVKFTVKGAVVDANAPKEDFNDNQVPPYWTNNGMTISDGALTGSRTSYTMTTPKLVFTGKTFFVVKAKATDKWGTFRIDQSEDNGETWTELFTKDTDSGLRQDDWQRYAIPVTAGVNRLRFAAFDAAIDEITGLTYDGNDPKFELYVADEDGHLIGEPLTEPQHVDFGDGINSTQTMTYIVRNARLGTMKVAATVAPGATGISAAVNKETIGTGEEAVVTISLDFAADDIGAKSGVVTITGMNIDNDTIGSVEVMVSGHTRLGGKMFVTFDGGIPTGWTKGGWEHSTTNDGDAFMVAGATATRMVTSKISVEAGEKLYVTALGQLLTIYYSASKDGFNAVNKVSVPLGSEYREVEVAGIPATAKYLAFEGQNAYVTTIYGFAPDDSDPQMEVWIGGGKAATGVQTIDYGMVLADTVQELSIKNANTGSLQVTAINLPEGFVLKDLTAPTDDAPLEISAGESKTIQITMTTATVGRWQGTVTIKGNDQPDFTLTVTGYVMNPAKMLATFDDNQLPAGWKNGVKGAPWLFADGMAYGEYADYKNARMQTPRLTIAEGEEMVFMLKGNAKFAELKVEAYEPLGSEPVATFNFNELAEQTYQDGRFQMVTVGGLAAGDYRLVFDGYKTYIDNINGFSVNPNDPVLAVYDDEATSHQVASPQQYDFRTQCADTTVHYYIKNTGTGTLTVTAVTVSADAIGITAAMEGATSLSNATDHLTLGITMSAATAGQKGGTVTVETNAGTFVIAVSGFVKYPEPLMTISEEDAANHDFGMQTADASYTITIRNDGDADLVGVKAVLTAGAASDYTAVLAAEGEGNDVISAGKSATLTITQKYDATTAGSHSDVLTITAANVDTRYVIALSGNTLPPYAFQLAGSTLPAPAEPVVPGSIYNATVNVTCLRPAENITAQLLFTDSLQSETVVAEISRGIPMNTTETITLSGLVPETEGTYQVFIRVSSASGTTNETGKAEITLKHRRTMVLKDQEGNVMQGNDSISFGTVTDAVSKTYILTNTGTTQLTGIKAVLTAGDASDYTAVLAAEGEDNDVIAVGKSATLTITQKYDAATVGSYCDILTITAAGVDARYVIALSGNTLPPYAFQLAGCILPEPVEPVEPDSIYTATVNVACLRPAETITAQLLFTDSLLSETVAAEVSRAIPMNTTETITLSGQVPETEGTYQVFIRVTSASGTIGETERVSVTVKHQESEGVIAIFADGDQDGNKPIYNLRGERVIQPRKGQLYIRNGKKFVKR